MDNPNTQARKEIEGIRTLWDKKAIVMSDLTVHRTAKQEREKDWVARKDLS